MTDSYLPEQQENNYTSHERSSIRGLMGAANLKSLGRCIDSKQLAINECSPKPEDKHPADAILDSIEAFYSVDDKTEAKDIEPTAIAPTEGFSRSTSPITVTTPVIPQYRFLEPDDFVFELTALIGKSDKALVARVGELSYSILDDDGSHIDYIKIRNEFCALNYMLNTRGVIAPRFREMRKPPRPPKVLKDSEKLLSNDRQVIDLHWIQGRGLNSNEIPGYKSMLDKNAAFSFALASKFVSTVGKRQDKALAIGLSKFDQLQLSTIFEKSVSDRWRTIDRNVFEKTSSLRSLASESKSRIPITIALSLPNIYRALMMAEGAPKLGCAAYKLITGEELHSRQMQRYADKLNALGLMG